MRPIIGRTLGVTAALVLALAAPALSAQEPGQPPPPQEREALEARLRQRMAEVVKRQVGLNDEQMRRLGATNRRFETQRRELMARERDIRGDLRDEIESGDTTRSAQVSRLLDQMLQVQRQRLELLESEQKELATFMSPHQRARYFGIEEQMRRRVEEMRDARPPAGGARRPPPMGAPGGRPGGAGGGPVGGGVRRPPPGE